MSLYPREIITLQVGHYSNFIGTHWWNLQEASFVYDDTRKSEINHNYLFRTGCLPNKQITFTPRLVVVDSKESLGCLPSLGTLYDNPSPSINHAQWDGKVKFVQQLLPDKNRFLQALEEEDNLYLDEEKDTLKISIEELKNERLQDEMKVWSDFLRPHLHPNSVFTFNDVCQTDNNTTGHVWSFQEGLLAMNQQMIDGIVEKIRFQAESCDSLQGFHMLCDGHNGMGGVSSMLAEYIKDEYGTKDVFSFVSTPPHFNPSSRSSVDMYLSSLLQCYSELSKSSTVVTPLNLRRHCWHPSSRTVNWPYIEYNSKSAYETSSILASFLETVTTCYRTKENPSAMMHLSELLTPVQRKFVSGRLMLPYGIPEDGFLLDCLQNKELDSDGISISGVCDENRNLCSVSVLRGLTLNRMKSKFIKIPQEMSSPEQYLQMLILKGENPANFHNRIVSDGLFTSIPYPHIFKDNVTVDGFINHDSKRSGAVSTVLSMASLNQSQSMKSNLKQILTGVEQLDVNKLPKLIEAGLDREAWKEIVEQFTCLIENYGPL